MPKKITKKKAVKKVADILPSEAIDLRTAVTLKCMGRTFNAEGKTLEDAISKIKISGGTNALSVLTVIQGERKRIKLLNARITNALFGHLNNTAKMIGLKNVNQMFP